MGDGDEKGEKAGLTAVSSEREEGVGRKDAGVLRDGKTSFSGKKSTGGAVGPGLLLVLHRADRFTRTSSFLRLGRTLGALLCVNTATGAATGLVRALGFSCFFWCCGRSTSMSMSKSTCRFSRSLSSAHSSAASKYAGEKEGLVFKPPLLVSPTCSDPSAFAARLPGTSLPLWPDRLGIAGLRLL